MLALVSSLYVVGALARSPHLRRPHAAAKDFIRSPGPINNPEEWVNTLGGTKAIGGQEDSFGNILPEVSYPWGFNGWAPITNPGNGGWWFQSEDRNIYGVRCTKQPSPWIGDYGDFRIMTHVIDEPGHGNVGDHSAYNPANSQWSPYFWNASLLSFGNRAGFASIELTSTMHGAILRFKYPPYAGGPADGGYNQTRRILISLDAGSGDVAIPAPGADGLVVATGTSVSNSGGVSPSFGHFFYATLGGGADGATPITPFASGTDASGNPRWLWFDFDPRDTTTDTIVMRIATSLISPAQAAGNHASQVKGVAFDAAMAASKALWHSELSRVTVQDAGSAYPPSLATGYITIFYSSLYRASKFPRALWETDVASGTPVHYSPYKDSAQPGVFSTDQGFWDAYRSTYSLLALWRPDRFALQMEGWLNAWREGGWVPQWSSPGYRGSMTGTMSDVTMSEAIVKLPHCPSTGSSYCVNASGLYTASRQNAFVPPVGTPEGRECLLEYIALGYVPSDGGCDAVVSRTLNYLHSDWALSQAASLLGLTDEAQVLATRASNWTKLLDPATGFMRQRKTDGTFATQFDEFAWGPSVGYTEAGPWQYRVEVPYDPASLATGLKALGLDPCDIVQQANTIPSAFHPGGYGGLIHEQSEMAVNCWSQWELNNQPVWAMQHMQVAFDTSVSGKCAQQAHVWLRQSADIFSPTDKMFPGDEDNGSVSVCGGGEDE